MDLLDIILTRTTVPQVKIGEPGPDADQLNRILAAGTAAPDHGRLRPWRFLIVEGSARHQLGELFARAVLAANPAASSDDVERQRQAPLRVPLLLIVIARIDGPVDAKVPEIERIASAAAAAQNILLACHSLGFAAKWSTGKNAYDPTIRDGLGLGNRDQLIGFLYIGTASGPMPPSPRPALDEVTARWPA